jgi:hypothetical protein
MLFDREIRTSLLTISISRRSFPVIGLVRETIAGRRRGQGNEATHDQGVTLPTSRLPATSSQNFVQMSESLAFAMAGTL